MSCNMVCHAMFITNADFQLVSGVLCHVTMVCHAMFITNADFQLDT